MFLERLIWYFNIFKNSITRDYQYSQWKWHIIWHSISINRAITESISNDSVTTILALFKPVWTLLRHGDQTISVQHKSGLYFLERLSYLTRRSYTMSHAEPDLQSSIACLKIQFKSYSTNVAKEIFKFIKIELKMGRPSNGSLSHEDFIEDCK